MIWISMTPFQYVLKKNLVENFTENNWHICVWIKVFDAVLFQVLEIRVEAGSLMLVNRVLIISSTSPFSYISCLLQFYNWLFLKNLRPLWIRTYHLYFLLHESFLHKVITSQRSFTHILQVVTMRTWCFHWSWSSCWFSRCIFEFRLHVPVVCFRPQLKLLFIQDNFINLESWYTSGEKQNGGGFKESQT